MAPNVGRSGRAEPLERSVCSTDHYNGLRRGGALSFGAFGGGGSFGVASVDALARGAGGCQDLTLRVATMWMIPGNTGTTKRGVHPPRVSRVQATASASLASEFT